MKAKDIINLEVDNLLQEFGKFSKAQAILIQAGIEFEPYHQLGDDYYLRFKSKRQRLKAEIMLKGINAEVAVISKDTLEVNVANAASL